MSGTSHYSLDKIGSYLLFVPLGKQGARGVLFRVTLLIYGYNFVSYHQVCTRAGARDQGLRASPAPPKDPCAGVSRRGRCLGDWADLLLRYLDAHHPHGASVMGRKQPERSGSIG